MNKFVKTGNDIQVELNLLWKDDGLENKSYDKQSSKKYLVLPEGLDALEDVLTRGIPAGDKRQEMIHKRIERFKEGSKI